MNTLLSPQKNLIITHINTNNYIHRILLITLLFSYVFPTRGQSQILLAPSLSPEKISIQQAVTLTITHQVDHRLAINQKNLIQAQKISITAELLPKLRGSMRYTRNIPEVKTNLANSNPSQAFLSRKVAQLLASSGDLDGADQLNSSADQMQRRPSSGEIITRPKHAVDSTLTLEIPLLNGPNFARFLQIKDNILLQQAKVLESQAKRVFDVANIYFQALHQKDLVKQIKLQITTNLEHHQQISDQFKIGLVSKQDELRSKHALSHMQLREKQAILDLRKSIAQLGTMIGKNEDFEIMSISEITATVFENNIQELYQIALNQRSDLQAQEKAVTAAGKERLSSILQFLPTISFVTDANYTSNTEGLSSESLTFAFSLNANYTFFNGGSRFGTLKESALKRQAEQIKLDHLKQNIIKQIRAHKTQLKLLLLERQNKKLELETHRTILANTKAKYFRGLENLTNYLQAQHEFFDKEISIKKTQFEIEKEKLAFLNSLGVLSTHIFASDS